MPPEQDPLYDALDPATLAVRDLIGASRQLVGRIANEMGMNPNDMSAIGLLAQEGPMGVAEIADHLGIRSASATALVDRLERAGHVERVRDTADRRRVTVVETPAARAAAYEAWRPVIAAINDLCRTLSDAERDVIRDFLVRATALVDPTAGQANPKEPGRPGSGDD